MNKREKKVFIESITETVKNDVIKQIDKMPERWDGDVMINGL